MYLAVRLSELQREPAPAHIPVFTGVPPDEDRDAAFAYALLRRLQRRREDVANARGSDVRGALDEHAAMMLSITQMKIREHVRDYTPQTDFPCYMHGTIVQPEMDAFVAKFLARYV